MTALRRTVAAKLLLLAAVSYAASMLLPVDATPGNPRPMVGWQLFCLGMLLFWVGLIGLPVAIAGGKEQDFLVALWCLCWLANPLFWGSLVGFLRAVGRDRRPRWSVILAYLAAGLAVSAGAIDRLSGPGSLLRSPGYLAWAGSMSLGLVVGVILRCKDDVELPDAEALQPFHAGRPSAVGSAAVQPATSRGVRAS